MSGNSYPSPCQSCAGTGRSYETAGEPSTPRDPLIVGADRMATEIDRLVTRGIIDARSPAADAALDYATSRHGSSNPIGELRAVAASVPSREAGPRRCAVCDLPLAASASDGCVEGNCSMRPRPAAPLAARSSQSAPNSSHVGTSALASLGERPSSKTLDEILAEGAKAHAELQALIAALRSSLHEARADSELLDAISKPNASVRILDDGQATVGVPRGRSIVCHTSGVTLRSAIRSALGSVSGAAPLEESESTSPKENNK